MNRLLLTLFGIAFISSIAGAQLQIQASFPLNNATNVPLSTTLALAFSGPVDTTGGFGMDAGVYTNANFSGTGGFSATLDTFYLPVTLEAGKTYFLCVYTAHAMTGPDLPRPFALNFTTAPTFPAYTVSGSVTDGGTGVSPAYAMVLLSLTSLNEGNPVAVAGAVADSLGHFVIPYVATGTFYPLAARDLNNDGSIDPSRGDVVGTAGPVSVTGANVTGVSIAFMSFAPPSFTEATAKADSISGTIPFGQTLRKVSGWGIDSAGVPESWEFTYINSANSTGSIVRIGAMETRVETADPNTVNWIKQMRPIPTLNGIASPESVMAKVERAGGAHFRHLPFGDSLQLQVQISFGDLNNSEFQGMTPDISLFYWGVVYQFGRQVSGSNWVTVKDRKFLSDAATGTVVTFTSVPQGPAGSPVQYALEQNYPNPFNPSTTLRFSLPMQSRVRLDVYNTLGERVATVLDGVRDAGTHEVVWNTSLPSGIYFYRFEGTGIDAHGASSVLVRTMTVLR